MGLGVHGGGVAATRYLAEQGAQVTISDRAQPDTLAVSLRQLDGLSLAGVRLGGHDECDFRTAEWVVVNPAVPPDHPCLQIARDSGARLTSEIELFLERCPAPMIGVTGTNGKSTTCTMLAEILRAAGRRTWLGGNIGTSLLGQLERMQADDQVVLELSSFQLAHLSPAARLPQIAVVTNCSPNHLDWHGDYADYARAKQRLLGRVEVGSAVVLNALDNETAAWASLVQGEVVMTGPLQALPPLFLPGAHNRQNAACAAAAARLTGVDAGVIREALQTYRGLEHRLELVAEIAGRRFYNDSKSTSPRATLAALEALPGPKWLLAGGHAKGASFDELAAAIVAKTRGAGFFGRDRAALRHAVLARQTDFAHHVTEQLVDALDWCWNQSARGDVILLSPACASHDQYRDFAARGEQFCEWVRAIGAREEISRAESPSRG